MKLQRSALMHLIRKSALKTNRMDRFENHVLLDIAFMYIYIYTESYILGKIIYFQDILFLFGIHSHSPVFTKLTNPLRLELRSLRPQGEGRAGDWR